MSNCKKVEGQYQDVVKINGSKVSMAQAIWFDGEIAEEGAKVSMPSNVAIHDLDIVDEIDRVLKGKCETLDDGSNAIVMNGEKWQYLITDLYKLVKKYEKEITN